VVPWSGAPPPQRPRRPPGHAAGLQDAHTPSCRHSPPHQRPRPGGAIPTNGRPARPCLNSAGDRPRALGPPRGSPGWHHRHAPGRTPTPGHWMTLYPRAAEAGTDAHQPPHCQNRAGIGMAAHRPPHALPGHSHRPGPARCENRRAAYLHARRPDAQRHRPHARYQAAQLPRHAGPPNQADPAPRLSPGRQGPARNHVPPNPHYADRTSLPPLLPPPLPVRPFHVPHTVSASGLPGRGVLSAPR
jgi:hypothetical protein